MVTVGESELIYYWHEILFYSNDETFQKNIQSEIENFQWRKLVPHKSTHQIKAKEAEILVIKFNPVQEANGEKCGAIWLKKHFFWPYMAKTREWVNDTIAILIYF